MLYLMNSAVITSPGVYSYELISFEKAKSLISSDEYLSTIGYEETASVLSEALGVKVPVNRRTVRMKEGDRAIVFRIVLPEGSPRIDPKDKGQISAVIAKNQWELGLLTCLSSKEVKSS
ncbi:MAG: DUF1874 domain-containing protein [Thermoproteota archaeon]